MLRAITPVRHVLTAPYVNIFPNRMLSAQRMTIARFASSQASEKPKTQSEPYTTTPPASGHSNESRAESIKVSLPGQSSLNDAMIAEKPSFLYSSMALPPRQDPLLHFFVNLLMRDGKKASAERYITNMLADMARLTNKDPLPLVYEAVELAKPLLRMQSRKMGGKTLQVPIPLNQRQSTRRALKWIIQASDRRADRAIGRRLAVEVLSILEGNSSVLSRRDEQHKIGTNNRANASVRI